VRPPPAAPAAAATTRKVSPPLSWEKPVAGGASAVERPAKKTISFSDITEGEEDEEEEEINAAELYKHLGNHQLDHFIYFSKKNLFAKYSTKYYFACMLEYAL